MEAEIKELADSIYRRKVMRARELSPQRKMGTGAELYIDSCVRMRSGIRMQFTGIDEGEVERILQERLNRLRKLHEQGLYRPTPA